MELNMRRFFACLLIFTLLLPACLPSSLTVVPASPADGSTVNSTSPTLSWGGGAAGATYHLVIATDSNFQSIALNADNLADVSYTVPADKLSANTTYYWRVLARKGDQVSSWTTPWSFRTSGGAGPGGNGSIRIAATLDGAPWAGAVNFRITGSFSDSENTVPWSFNSVAAGSYTLTYNFGGPQNATLTSITPSPTQQLAAGGTVYYTLNFNTQSDSSINVSATLDGAPWSGGVNYSIYGPFKDTDQMVPHSFMSVAPGAYTLSYNSGGPQNAVFSGISPSTTQTLQTGSELNYVLNFTSSQSSNLSVTAYYNGVSWSGPATFSLSGPVSGAYSSVPLQLSNIPAGTYRITYQSGGPSGAALGSISPGNSITISSGRSGGFTLNYSGQQQSGNIIVNATLNGAAWSGAVTYGLEGPYQSWDHQTPRTYSSLPVGTYTLNYMGGGPDNAVLNSISPMPTQTLTAGRTIVFTMNFTGQQATGTVRVNATVDGQPWQTAMGSGPISYSISGPNLTDTEDVIPGSFTSLPAGTYTLIYNSGGPIGATLTGISPSPTLNLAPGGIITFSLNFSGQARGYVTVDATLNGEIWSGECDYTVAGPYVESGSTVSNTFSNLPQGTYTVAYREGGPSPAEFIGVSPSSQTLSPGGSISFVIMFRSLLPQPGPSPMPGPVPNPTPEPMPGPVPNPTPEPMPGPVPNPTPEPMPGPLQPDED